MNNELEQLEQRMKSYISDKIDRNNASIQSIADLQNTNIYGYRGLGLHQMLKHYNINSNNNRFGSGNNIIVQP